MLFTFYTNHCFLAYGNMEGLLTIHDFYEMETNIPNTLVCFYRTAWHHTPENYTPQTPMSEPQISQSACSQRLRWSSG
jgi:hypothetical protein